jgi:hypothetical protein
MLICAFVVICVEVLKLFVPLHRLVKLLVAHTKLQNAGLSATASDKRQSTTMAQNT